MSFYKDFTVCNFSFDYEDHGYQESDLVLVRMNH